MLQYQYEIFGQAWIMLKKMLDTKKKYLLSKGDFPDLPCVKKKSGKKGKKYKAIKDRTDQIVEDGVSVVISHEGGYCSVIVALMAIKRIKFDIVIPEQIIIMDQQHFGSDTSQSIMRRFSDHTISSGRKMEDLEVDFPDEPQLSNTGRTHVVQEKLKYNEEQNMKLENEKTFSDSEALTEMKLITDCSKKELLFSKENVNISMETDNQTTSLTLFNEDSNKNKNGGDDIVPRDKDESKDCCNEDKESSSNINSQVLFIHRYQSCPLMF